MFFQLFTEPERNQFDLAATGVRLGTKVALVSLILYLPVYTLWISHLTNAFRINPDWLSWFPGTLALIFVIGGLFGTLPVIVLGAITGWLIAISIKKIYGRLSSLTAIVPGLLISLTVVLFMNLLLSPVSILRSQNFVFLIWLNAPSIIYVLAGGYASTRLYRRYAEAQRQTSETDSITDSHETQAALGKQPLMLKDNHSAASCRNPKH